MKKKYNPFNNLSVKDMAKSYSCCLDADTDRIKSLVKNTIPSAHTERTIYMKHKKRIPVIAAAATVVLGISVFAAGSIVTSITSHSSAVPEYTSFSKLSKCAEDVDFAPILMEEFENGYKFDNGSLVNQTVHGEDGVSLNNSDTLFLRYEKDGDTLNFSQEEYTSLINPSGEVVSSFEGTDIYYSSYTNKVVPTDYEMTEEDKKAEENGDLVFSWGSSEVMINECKSVSFVKDSILINIFQSNGKLSPDELVEIAEEIIAE